MELVSKRPPTLLSIGDRNRWAGWGRTIVSEIVNRCAASKFSYCPSFAVFLFFSRVTLVGTISYGQEETAPAIPLDVPSEKPKFREAIRVEFPYEASSSPKVIRYARHLLDQYDRNRDGRLQQNEWLAMKGQPELIDRDVDGAIGLDELIHWIADYGGRKRIGVLVVIESADVDRRELQAVHRAEVDSAAKPSSADAPVASPGERRRNLKFYVPSKRLPPGLPDWFLAKDLDGDGQLNAGEFSPAGLAEELAEFSSYDANGDGVLTANEWVRRSLRKSDR